LSVQVPRPRFQPFPDLVTRVGDPGSADPSFVSWRHRYAQSFVGQLDRRHLVKHCFKRQVVDALANERGFVGYSPEVMRSSIQRACSSESSTTMVRGEDMAWAPCPRL
jgi:hypothetical protein